jgi:hypothetical protein
MTVVPGGGKEMKGERLAAKFSVQQGILRGGQRTRIN